MVRASHVLSLLALGAIVTAAPQLPSKAPKPVSTSAIAPTVTALDTASSAIITPSGTASAAPADASPIAIPESVIDAAPIKDISTNNTLVSIPGVVSNSTLVDARPDLQEYVNSANVTGNTTATQKRDLGKRIANPYNCNSNQNAQLSFDLATWQRMALRVCKSWYPTSSDFQYDPASPWPTALKSSALGPINVGGGQIVKLTFKYGVNDWNLQNNLGWQPYYVPQGQALCIADLNTLITEMDSSCAFYTGYDTSGDTSGTGQPKWYTFIATT